MELSMPQKPVVSILIPVYNGLRFTLECVNAIRAFTRVPHEIVVCGLGNDGTVGSMMEFESKLPNFKFVHNDTEHTHFAANVNMGAKQCIGDFICILNNDAVVTPGWLEKMLSVYNRINMLSERERPCPPPAIIGPCSNYVMQHQAVKLPPDFKLENLPKFSQEIEKQFRGKWFYAAIVSGFCMLVKRSIFEQLGGLDEDFVNGNEDVDLCCRVADAGYSCIVDRSTFVFHYGSQTLNAFPEKDTDSGTANRFQMALKFAGPVAVERKISGNVRLKCSKEELEAWLKRHYDLFDTVNIVDDGSEWDMQGYLAENWPKVNFLSMPGALEVEQRRMLYLISYEQGMDWMVVLDHDEFFEEKVDRAYLQRLANLPLPACESFIARWIHMWNSPNTYHVQYPPHSGVFMRRVHAGLAFVGGTPGSSLHCSRIPETPIVGSALTNVHVLHYGYVDPEQRRRKREYYEAKDPNPIPYLVGGETYRHLTDQTNIMISEWRGSKNYTLSLCTMAEHEPIHKVQILFEQIGSLMDEVVCRVAPNSPFKELMDRWGVKYFEKEWNDNYADMRNAVISKATSRYILMMDIDESLTEPQEIPLLVEQQPTAVMFNINNIQPPPKPPAVTEIMRVFENRPDIRFYGRIHETIEDDVLKIRDKLILRARGVINHFGFLTERLPEKLKKYVKLNKRAIHENPKDPKPYFNLALHYLEEGEVEQAESHLKQAISLHPKFVLAKIELAKMYLRYAQSISKSCLGDIPQGHPLREPVEMIDRYLRNLVPPSDALIFPTLAKIEKEEAEKMEREGKRKLLAVKG